MKHRVLFILPDLSGGGAERVTLTLLKALDRERFDPLLYLIRRQGPLLNQVPADIPCYAASAAGQRVRHNLPVIFKDLRRELPSVELIVGCLELDASFVAWLLGAVARKPVVGWVHTPILDYLKRVPPWRTRAAHWVYPRLRRVVFPSQGAAQSLLQLTRVAPDRVTVIPNPVDVGWILQQSILDTPELSSLWIDKPLIIGMGRLEPGKHFDILIQAFAAACREGLDARLVILGEGPERSALERLVKDEQAIDRVKLPGFVPNPYPLLRRAALFVHPAQSEGFGMVLLEAMALGVPVIAAQGSVGPEEVLAYGKYGWLVSTDDISPLKEKLLCLKTGPEILVPFRQMAPARAGSYAVDQIVQQWQSMFESILC